MKMESTFSCREHLSICLIWTLNPFECDISNVEESWSKTREVVFFDDRVSLTLGRETIEDLVEKDD
jgi:hypothetical protein